MWRELSDDSEVEVIQLYFRDGPRCFDSSMRLKQEQGNWAPL